MKIQQLSIKNFKSFGSEATVIPFEDLTSFVGANSSGKSNILRALDLFFNFSSKRVNSGSFHNRDFNQPIEIGVTFADLNEDESATFRRHLSKDGTLTIIQQITPKTERDANGELIYGGCEQDKGGIRLAVRDKENFDWLDIDKPPTKTVLKKLWERDLVFPDGSDAKASFGAIPEPELWYKHIQEYWQQSSHTIDVVEEAGDSQILGWANKLQGNLPRFIFIEADFGLSEATKSTKGSVFSQLLEWVLGDLDPAKATEMQRQLNEILATAFEEGEGGTRSRLLQAQDALNGFIKEQFAVDVSLELVPPLIGDIISGSLEMNANDGFTSPISEKGHGFQRAIVFALLRTVEKIKTDARKSTILAIEEPELYLHPPMKRASYKLLRRLATAGTQVLYTTHDGYFVDVRYFDETRLVRREHKVTWQSSVSYLQMSQLVTHYKVAYGLDIKPKSIRDTFRRFYDEAKNEVFFASKVVIVEGESELDALPIYLDALAEGGDLDSIAIIHAGSVDAIDYVYIILNELRIPCYTIFDADAPVQEPADEADIARKLKRNKNLLQLCGAEDLIPSDPSAFPETTVHDRVAIWRNRFEIAVHHPLPNYDTLVSDAHKLYGRDSKRLVARYIAEQVVAAGADHVPSLITEVAAKVKSLQWARSCLKVTVTSEKDPQPLQRTTRTG